jgi:hypothetical protein
MQGPPGASANFQAAYQTFQRLQSQESQKLDQQRLGHGLPTGNANGAVVPNEGAGGGPTAQQQQFLAQMRAMGMGNFPQQQQQQQSQQQQGVPGGQVNMGGMNIPGMGNINMPVQGMSAQQMAAMGNMGNMGMPNMGDMTNMGGGMANMANMGNGLGNMGNVAMQGQPGGMQNLQAMQGMGMNIHSQQQGLNLPGMDNEQGRRQMLQK